MPTILLLLLLLLPTVLQAQSYNGEVEVFMIYFLGITAPIFFVIGTFLAIRYFRNATNPNSLITWTKTAWFFGGLNALIGLLWVYLIQLLFADGIGNGGIIFLVFLAVALLAFFPIGLMVLGYKKIK